MFLQSKGPYIDSDWLQSYMRKDDKTKWVDPRGFDANYNPNATIHSPDMAVHKPRYIDN